jgi:hypothetical protein
MGNEVLKRWKPGVRRENLLIVAGLVWAVAGGILSGRGLNYVLRVSPMPGLRIGLGLLFGGVFYVLLFAKISGKHIRRISGINIPYPCAFSFFNFRSYFMMGLMIFSGIMLRKFDVIDHDLLYTFYIIMGVPLLISASRFFYFRFTKKEIA